MYLNRRTYVKNWDHNGPENQHQITVLKGGVPRKDIKPERISYIIEQVAYWRKFNALHGWFVRECGGGVDECQEIHVSDDDMKKLLKTLKEVKSVIDRSEKITVTEKDWNGNDYNVNVYNCQEKINELLPPTQGFFFGGYQIDDYYKDDVESTIQVIEDLMIENEESERNGLWGGDFYYQASW